MKKSRDTILNVIAEINSNYQTAKKANENTTVSLRIITKEILLHSFEVEKSEITSVLEETCNAGRAIFSLYKNTKKNKKKQQKVKKFVEDRKSEERRLLNEWLMISNKLRTSNAETLFEIIKINRHSGFIGVSNYFKN